MSRFWHIVGIWFLFQLIVISALGNMKAAAVYGDAVRHGVDPTAAYNQKAVDDCSDSDGVIGFVGGLLVPLSATNLVPSDWCWNFTSSSN